MRTSRRSKASSSSMDCLLFCLFGHPLRCRLLVVLFVIQLERSCWHVFVLTTCMYPRWVMVTQRIYSTFYGKSMIYTFDILWHDCVIYIRHFYDTSLWHSSFYDKSLLHSSFYDKLLLYSSFYDKSLLHSSFYNRSLLRSSFYDKCMLCTFNI